jgi:VanZ family protein
MNPFFTFLSAAYIFGIVYLAGSPLVSRIAKFNPYSVLHIPFYGILTILLLLAFASKPETSHTSRYSIAAWVAIAVAVVDEYLQSFIPAREASMGDVLLDILGVGLVMILARRIPPLVWMNTLKKLKK